LGNVFVRVCPFFLLVFFSCLRASSGKLCGGRLDVLRFLFYRTDNGSGPCLRGGGDGFIVVVVDLWHLFRFLLFLRYRVRFFGLRLYRRCQKLRF
jgi:hypothetical protein